MENVDTDFLDETPEEHQNGKAADRTAELADAAAAQYAEDEEFASHFDAKLDALRHELIMKLRGLEARLGVQKPEGLRPGTGSTVRKARARAKPVVKPAKASSTDKVARALSLLRAAGKEGVGTIALGRALKCRAGEVMAPLVETGKVKQKGEKRGTTYFLA